jgi:hypothetical protein
MSFRRTSAFKVLNTVPTIYAYVSQVVSSFQYSSSPHACYVLHQSNLSSFDHFNKKIVYFVKRANYEAFHNVFFSSLLLLRVLDPNILLTPQFSKHLPSMLYLRCYIRIVLYKTAGSGKIKDQEE